MTNYLSLRLRFNHHLDACYENDSNYNRVVVQEESCEHNELNELLSSPDSACQYDLNGNLVKKVPRPITMMRWRGSFPPLLKAKKLSSTMTHWDDDWKDGL